MFKHSFIFAIAVFLTACANSPLPKQDLAQVAKQEPKTQNGYIKGKISKIYYTNDGFRYEIQGTDTSNGKLSFATVKSTSQSLKMGDLVYAKIENDYITYIKVLVQTHQSQKPKMRIKNKTSQIKVPSVEKIDF